MQIAAEIDEIMGATPCAEGLADLSDAQPDDVAHDAYFHVSRMEGDSEAIFVRMALSARRILMRDVDEAPVSIAHSMLALIDRSLADLTNCLAGGTVDTAPVVTQWRSRGAEPRPRMRWIRGHQIFAALTQSLVFSFKSMGHAIRAGQTSDVRRWADLCISLLRGSGASFVLTGDLSVEDYNSVIRPSMMPPAAPICLSGLMSVDHRVLVQTIRDLRPALKSLHEHERARHEQIFAELKTVYDRHIFVCERFVGDRPSLLTAGSTEKSGPALIEQFKSLRLKSFDSTPHAARLAPDRPSPSGASCPFAKQLPRSGDQEVKH